MENGTHHSSTRKVWLVTGCSSGLGRQLMLSILGRGDKVIATARNISDLQCIGEIEGAAENALPITLDVSEPYQQLKTKIDDAVRHFGTIDVLVNSAGFVSSGVWEETSYEDLSSQFETNFFGALKVTQCVLPHMRKKRSGTILFMGSISGWHGVGAGGPYSASKFALEGAAECLAEETASFGVRTHVLVLGQFRTNILDKTRKHDNLKPSNIPEYDAIKQQMSDRHKETNHRQPGDPEAAAQRILDIARQENLTKEQICALPLRIPLGSDALDVIKRKCTDTLKSLKGWEEFAASTDFEMPSRAVPSYYR